MSVSFRRGGLADAEDLISFGGNSVWVRFPPPVICVRSFAAIGFNPHRTRKRRRVKSPTTKLTLQIPRADRCLPLHRLPTQTKNRDCFRLRIDDPVFRHACLGIVAPFVDQISLRLLFTHYLQSEIGAKPEPVLPPRSPAEISNTRSGSRNFPGRTLSRNGAKWTLPPRVPTCCKNARKRNWSTLWCLSVGMGKASKKPSVNSISRLRWSVRTRYSSSLHAPWGEEYPRADPSTPERIGRRS